MCHGILVSQPEHIFADSTNYPYNNAWTFVQNHGEGNSIAMPHLFHPEKMHLIIQPVPVQSFFRISYQDVTIAWSLMAFSTFLMRQPLVSAPEWRWRCLRWGDVQLRWRGCYMPPPTVRPRQTSAPCLQCCRPERTFKFNSMYCITRSIHQMFESAQFFILISFYSYSKLSHIWHREAMSAEKLA